MAAVPTRDLNELKPLLDKRMRSFPDFPKKGILFRDIMPLFTDPALVAEFCRSVALHCKKSNISVDAVAGLEARGFLFGPQIAAELNVPFIPIRKKGKLPGETVSASYIKEYGEDVVEVQIDAVKAGGRVLIFDDLLATGGTMKAAVELIRKAGGAVALAFCIIELADLNGKALLPADTPLLTLIKY